MAKCKLGCGNEAVEGKWRKRYCRTCGENYLRKRKEYEARGRALPMCAGGCGKRSRGSPLYPNGPLVPHVNELCHGCESEREEDAAKRAANDLKLHYLDNAETVHELREWIKEYML
jgi:hypothetical protein